MATPAPRAKASNARPTAATTAPSAPNLGVGGGAMTAPVLEQQEVVGAPRVSGPAHLRVGIGSKVADSIEGQAKIAAALSRYAEYCRYTGTPFEFSLEVEIGEPVGREA